MRRSSAIVESPHREEIVDSERAAVALTWTFFGRRARRPYEHRPRCFLQSTTIPGPGLSPATVPGVWRQMKSVLFSESTVKPALVNVLAAVPAGSPVTFGTVVWLVTSKVTCP